jgi:uncharacterized membrane protein
MMVTGMHSFDFGYGRGMMGPGMMFGGVIAWLFFLAVLFLVAYVLVRAIRNRGCVNNLVSGVKNTVGTSGSSSGSDASDNQKPDPALETLKMRLVRGEIKKQEYMELKNVLLGIFPEDATAENSAPKEEPSNS